jgi:hypothetical protein
MELLPGVVEVSEVLFDALASAERSRRQSPPSTGTTRSRAS